MSHWTRWRKVKNPFEDGTAEKVLFSSYADAMVRACAHDDTCESSRREMIAQQNLAADQRVKAVEYDRAIKLLTGLSAEQALATVPENQTNE